MLKKNILVNITIKTNRDISRDDRKIAVLRNFKYLNSMQNKVKAL